MERKKRKVAFQVFATPQAYVMPDEVELTDSEYDAMTDAERDQYFARHARRFGAYVGGYSTDPLQDAIESEEFHQWFDDMDDDEIDSLGMTEIDKAAAPIIAAAEYADFVRETPHDSVAYGVEIDSRQEAVKLLLVAVTVEVNRWRKPPKAEVTAAGIGLAVAHVRREQAVKHPRDVAKEVGVRVQTLFDVRKLALQEIQRLKLTDALMGSDEENTGTYNSGETGEDHAGLE